MNEHTHRKSDIHVVFIRNSSLNFVHGTIFSVCVLLGRYNSIRCAWNDSKLIEEKFTDTSIERFVSYTLFHPK